MNLPDFEQSAFLQSLGWAIANSIWQGGLLWVFYHLLILGYSSCSAKFKNNLGTLLLFGNFTWFIATFFERIIHLRNIWPSDTANQLPLLKTGEVVSENINFPGFIPAIVITLPYLSVAYLLLLVIFVIKLVNSYRNTNFIKHNGLKKPGAEWRVFVDKVANHIGLNTKIRIWFSEYVNVPATIGFLKPVILIPMASLNQLTPAQMEAIILHEISHIKRNDYLVNLFVSLVETILFFNPFVVLLGNIIKKERENCCDDFVLQYQYDRHSYASALLVLEQSREQQFNLALAATSGRKQLLFRIKRIMEVKRGNDGFNYGQKLVALLISTAIICSIAWLTPEKKTNLQPVNALQGKSSIIVATPSVSKINQAKIPSEYQETKKSNPPAKVQKPNVSHYSTLSPEVNPFPENLATSPVFNSMEGVKDWGNSYRSADAKLDYLAAAGIKNKEAINQLAQLNNANKADANLFFSPNSPFSGWKFFENLHLDLDYTKLKNDIEKEREFFSSINLEEIKDRIKESMDKIEMPKFKMSDKANFQMYFTPQNKEFGDNESNQRQWQKLNRNSDVRNRRKVHPVNDSLDVLPDEESNNDENQGDASEDDIINTITAPDDVVLRSPAMLNRKKIIVVRTPAPPPPAKRYEYAFQYKTTPQPKYRPSTSVRIDYKGGSIVLVNGEKINLAELKRSQAEKLVKTFTRKDNNLVIEGKFSD